MEEFEVDLDFNLDNTNTPSPLVEPTTKETLPPSTVENEGEIKEEVNSPNYIESIENVFGFTPDVEVTKENYKDVVADYFKKQAIEEKIRNIGDPKIATLIEENISLDDYVKAMDATIRIDNMSADDVLRSELLKEQMKYEDELKENATDEEKDLYSNALSEANARVNRILGNKTESWKETEAEKYREKLKTDSSDVITKIKNLQEKQLQVYIEQVEPKSLNELKQMDELFLKDLTSFVGVNLDDANKQKFLEFRQTNWKTVKNTDGVYDRPFNQILSDSSKVQKLELLWFLYEQNLLNDTFHTGKQKGIEAFLSEMPRNTGIRGGQKTNTITIKNEDIY